MITANQLRAARALLDISQGEIEQAIGISANTVSNIAQGTSRPAHETLSRLQSFFEMQGVEFTDNEGVRKKPSGIATYRGRDGFAEFIWDVYETVKKSGGEICVSNVDEALFTEKLGKDIDDAYMKKMGELKNFTFKILIKENDYNFIGSAYAEYKWLPQKLFFTVPFYVYGSKLAFLFLSGNPTIHVIENSEIADAQRAQFNLLWEQAILPKGK